MIESTTIARNPYAPNGAQDVKLYAFNGCDNLTVGQLVNVVCCKVGVALEDSSVNKANVITRHSRRLQGMSEVLAGIMDGKDYDAHLTLPAYASMTYRDFLTEVCGMTIGGEGNLPESVATPKEKISAYTAMKTVIEAATITSQRDMIDLQTAISRRDVAYSTATNVIRALGTTLQTTAYNY